MAHPAISRQMAVSPALRAEGEAATGTEVAEEMGVVNVRLVNTWNTRRYPMMLIQVHAACLRYG